MLDARAVTLPLQINASERREMPANHPMALRGTPVSFTDHTFPADPARAFMSPTDLWSAAMG
jgi:hypothetical protein